MSDYDLEYNELQGRINALKIAIRQTDSKEIEHLEHVVGAILLSMTPTAKNRFDAEIKKVESISDDEFATVRLLGEGGEDVKSMRQKWRKELAEIEISNEERGYHGQ